jgi:carboxypeptidase Taq
MATSYEQLVERLRRVYDVRSVNSLLFWDQQTMMPPTGAVLRAEQRATLDVIAHELFVADETGRLLDDVRPYEDSLDPDADEACLIRVVREDWEKARRVPSELRSELTRAGSQGLRVWAPAREESDYEALRPCLERNLELKLRYLECFPPADEPYDVLLDDYERGMRTAEVRAIFADLKDALVPLIGRISEHDDPALDECLKGDFPVDRQRALCHDVIELFGLRFSSWRLDPTPHPFAGGAGRDDIRVTTTYHPTDLSSLFASMHEYGHALYEHQVAPELGRTPLASGVSLGLHESQSRLWENLVGRGRPFWRFFLPRLRGHFPGSFDSVDEETIYRAVNRVYPSPIRIHADEVTYNLHVILRFELEQELVNGQLAVADLPDAWNARMWDYLGVEVASDREGVLQDMHWAGGSMGYFSTYSLGNVISVQIWERLRHDLPDLDEQLERGEFGDLREWLGDRLHRHGRKFSPKETLRRVVGGPIDPKPYLRYLEAKHGAGAGVAT